MATLIGNGFDSETTGALPSGWVDVGTSEGGTDGTGKATVQTAPSGFSGKSLQIAQYTTTSGRSYKTFTRQTSGSVSFQGKFKVGSTVAAGYRWMDWSLYDGTATAGAQIFRLLQIDSRVLLLSNGSTFLTITGITVNTDYTFSGTINIATKKLTTFVLNGTTYDNAGAGYSLHATMTGIDRLAVDAFSTNAAAGEYQWLDDVAVVTAGDVITPAAGTIGTATVDKNARVTLPFTAATGTTSLKVYRSTASGGTYVDITSQCTVTDNGSGSWTVVDRRPQYGSQAVATYGGTGYYKIAGVGALEGAASSVKTVASIDIDVPAIETARATLLHSLISAQSGGYYTSATSDVSGGEKYPGQWVLTMAQCYFAELAKSNTTLANNCKTDAVNEFNYLVSTITNADDLLVWPGSPTLIERDYHFRNILYCALAARLFHRAGDNTTAATIIAQCDLWAQAAFDNLNGGTPTSSITRHGWDANNASGQTNNTAWSAGATVTAGAIRKPTVNNARLYRARNSGTTGVSEPTWPTAVNSTVTDNGITWVCTSGAGSIFASTYSNTAGYASVTTGEYDVNQVVEIAAAYTALMTDATSAFYTAGTYRTKALTVTQDAVNLLMAYQITGGKVPIGDPLPPADGRPMYDTIYGGFTLTLAALIYRAFAANVHQDLSLFVSGVLDWFDTLTTEPLASTHYDSAAQIGFPELEFRAAGYRVMGRTNPLDKLWNTAAFNTTTDRWGWYSAVGSPSVSSPSVVSDGVQARSLLGAAWAAAVIEAPIEPAGVASTETVGSPTLTPDLPAVAPSGVASEEAVGAPTISGPSGPFTISPSGIASTEAVGEPSLPIVGAPASDLEGFVLDDLDLNTTGLYRLEEFVLGPPPKRYEWIANNDIDGADLLRDPSQDNRPWTLKVRLTGDTRDEVQAAHDAIVAKLEKAERNGRDGITAVWTPVDSTTSYDVIVLSGETTDFPVTVESGYFVNAPLITIQGLARPGLYLPEQTIGPITSSLPLIELELPDVPGQLPAEATITVGDAATKSRRHVTWGLEQRYYDSDSPASLILDAGDMTTSGYAGSLTTRSGSYGTNVVRVTDLPTNRWTAVAALTSQPHVGVFRVPVRGHGDSSTSLRISWRAGDGPYTAYPAVTVPVDGWFEIDLGAVVIPPAPIGAQTWDCRIEAMSTATGSDIDFDFASLIPAGEGFGRARAVAGNDAAGVVNGFDDFGSGAVSDPLNGGAADGGGSWATSGAATDFLYSDGLPTGNMAAARFPAVSEAAPRFAILGSTSYTDTEVEIARATYPGGVSWAAKAGAAVARFVDSSNYAFAERTPVSPFRLGVVVAGVRTILATASSVAPAAGMYERITLVVYASGRAVAYLTDSYGTVRAVVEASSSALATGGALASGKPGFYDWSTDTVSTGRYYDGFTHSIPAPEIVALNADRTIAFRHDTVRRENATGTAYGEPGMYRGGPAYVPPGGDDNLTSRVVIVARRNDIDESTSDDVTDATTVTITLRPRNLWPS